MDTGLIAIVSMVAVLFILEIIQLYMQVKRKRDDKENACQN